MHLYPGHDEVQGLKHVRKIYFSACDPKMLDFCCDNDYDDEGQWQWMMMITRWKSSSPSSPQCLLVDLGKLLQEAKMKTGSKTKNQIIGWIGWKSPKQNVGMKTLITSPWSPPRGWQGKNLALNLLLLLLLPHSHRHHHHHHHDLGHLEGAKQSSCLRIWSLLVSSSALPPPPPPPPCPSWTEPGDWASACEDFLS